MSGLTGWNTRFTKARRLFYMSRKIPSTGKRQSFAQTLALASVRSATIVCLQDAIFFGWRFRIFWQGCHVSLQVLAILAG
jgi:hypothetical protein